MSVRRAGAITHSQKSLTATSTNHTTTGAVTNEVVWRAGSGSDPRIPPKGQAKRILEVGAWSCSGCGALLEHEEDEDEDEFGGGRRRKKPWRYRWPDDFRDEVLARLLELNKQRAEQERLTGTAAEVRTKKPRKATKKGTLSNEPDLFGDR